MGVHPVRVVLTDRVRRLTEAARGLGSSVPTCLSQSPHHSEQRASSVDDSSPHKQSEMRKNLMKKQWLGIELTMCLGSCTFAQMNSQVPTLRPYHKQPAPPPCTGPCLIQYNGGPGFEKAPTVYIIWYGNWTAKDKSIIDS